MCGGTGTISSLCGEEDRKPAEKCRTTHTHSHPAFTSNTDGIHVACLYKSVCVLAVYLFPLHLPSFRYTSNGETCISHALFEHGLTFSELIRFFIILMGNMMDNACNE